MKLLRYYMLLHKRLPIYTFLLILFPLLPPLLLSLYSSKEMFHPFPFDLQIRVNTTIRWFATERQKNKKTYIYIYDWSRFVVRCHPAPQWYGPKTCVLQHSAWKRGICSVFCTVGGWRGPQTCKFVGSLQPAFRKRVICKISASTSWSSAVAPPSM